MAKIRDFDFIDEQKKVVVLYDPVFPLYIIRGARNFLIDSAATAKSQEYAPRIKGVLAATGAGRDEGIDILMLTHSHWDHVGGSSYLQQQFNFTVYGSTRCVEVLQNPKAIHFINRLNQDYMGMVKDTSGHVFSGLEKLHALAEGDRVEVGEGSYLEVVETPGHTRCSMSYLLQPQRILFLGDAGGVIEKDGSIKPLFLSSYLQMVQSVQKLINLDVEVLAFPHNRRIKGKEAVKQHFLNCLERADWLKDQILEMLKQETDITKMAAELLVKLFSKPTLMGPTEAQLINLEAMIHVVKRELGN